MSLQETLTNQELENLDLSKVAALQQKRILAFVNHFTLSTVQFLNNFAKECETKLMHFERKIEKVEAAMVLLEARLSSIPEIKNSTTESPEEKQIKTEDTIDKKTATSPSQDIPHTEQVPSPSTEEIKAESSKVLVSPEIKEENTKVKVSPEYERFVKMVQVGVPLEAAKLKASLEGLDPNILQQLIKK